MARAAYPRSHIVISMTGAMLAITSAQTTSVAALVHARAAVEPDRIAIVDGARRLSYGELAERTSRLAGALASRGVTAGDRIAVLAENRLQIPEPLLPPPPPG